MLQSTLLLLSTGLLALASPAPRSSKSFAKFLDKRDPPIIDGAFSEQEKKQASEGARDALQLAYYALTPSAISDEIFAKWFHPDDRDTVNKVFDAILGDDHEDGKGNALLGKLKIMPDYQDPDDGEFSCDGDTQAETRDAGGENPEIIMCPKGFKSGGIGKGYDGVDPVRCDKFDDRVSSKMESLGSILIHEYTHYDNLVNGILSKLGTDDHAYGPYDSQQLSREDKLDNADNYSWFANELHWTIICGKSFDAPTKADSKRKA
ncbi:hypothetical protein FSHL1_009812 [Fusarium sambucinum]